MNTTPNQIENLELLLMKIMIQIIIRDPNGWMKIERARKAVAEAGVDLADEFERPLLRLVKG